MPSDDSTLRPGAAPPPGARYALGLLLVVYFFSNIDRQILQILVEPIRLELGVSDTRMGLLVGIGFTLFYTLAGLPVARWADRRSRKALISVAIALWSAMTVLSGLVRSYSQLLLARIGVGVGEAGCTPPAHSILSDYFPAERRGAALGVYQTGVNFGLLVGMGLGGLVADRLGWRAAFVIAGAPGLLLAAVVALTLREPRRGLAEGPASDSEVPSLGETLRFLWSLRSLRHALLAIPISTFVLAAGGAWQPAMLIRLYDLSLTQAGVALGLINGVAGALGTYLGGALGDRLARRDPRGYLWVPAVSSVAALPLLLGVYATDTAGAALTLLAPAIALQFGYSAVGYALVQSLVQVRMRALASAITLFAINIFGSGLGPFACGWLSDALQPRFGDESVRYSLAILSFGLLWAAVHYLQAARSYADDLRAKDRPQPIPSSSDVRSM